MRVGIGAIEAVPDDRCIAIADGAAIAIRVDDEVVAFQNRCLHQESPLAEGRVFGGQLGCPLHFWRYELPSGRHTGNRGTLPSYPVEVIDGEVFVEIPDPEPPMSMRERLLKHAREWERDA